MFQRVVHSMPLRRRRRLRIDRSDPNSFSQSSSPRMTTASYEVFFGLQSPIQVRLTPMTEKKLTVTSMPAFNWGSASGRVPKPKVDMVNATSLEYLFGFAFDGVRGGVAMHLRPLG